MITFFIGAFFILITTLLGATAATHPVITSLNVLPPLTPSLITMAPTASPSALPAISLALSLPPTLPMNIPTAPPLKPTIRALVVATIKPTSLPIQIPTFIPTLVPAAKPTMLPTAVPTPLPPSPTPTLYKIPTQAAQTIPSAGLSADKLFTMTNDYRQQYNLSLLQKDKTTCDIAAYRAPQVYNEIYGGMMHQGFWALTLPYYATENIISYNTEEGAFTWWISDKIHRDAIVGNYTYSCVACYGYSCSQVFTSYVSKY